MSLRDVIADIASDMDRDADEWERAGDQRSVSQSYDLRSYAKQLRRALKASEGERQAVARADVGDLPAELLQNPELQHAAMIEKAKAELRRAKAAANKAEDNAFAQTGYDEGTGFVCLVGGNSDGLMVPMAGNAPIGAKTMVGGQVYCKGDDGRWCFLPG